MVIKDTRQRIMESALTSFSTLGYAGTSMRKLAADVGLKPASLYAHFDGKETILQSLLQEQGPNAAITALRQVMSHPSQQPAAQLRQFTEELISVWTTDQARQFRAMITRLPPELEKNTYLHGVQAVLDAVAAVFETWQSAGTMRTLDAPPLLAWAFMAPIGNLRTSFWSVEASHDELKHGVTLARQHVALFCRIHMT